MSDRGGYRSEEGEEMSRRMGDNEIEQIIAGEPTGDPALDELSGLVAEIAVPDEIDPSVAARHVADVAAEAGAAAPSPRNTHSASEPVPWYRRVVVRGVASGLAAKIVLGTALAIATTGGAAATGLVDLFAVDDLVVERAIVAHGEDQVPTASTTTTEGPDEPAVAASTSTTATSSSTSTTSPTTSTTEAEDDEDEFPLVAGPRSWESTSCDGRPISIDYRLTSEGTLQLDSVTGEYDDLEVRAHRIRVRFDHGVEVDIRVEGDVLTVDEDRSCEGEPTSSSTTTEPEDDEGGDGTTTTTEPEDDGKTDESTTTTTEPEDD